MGEAVRLPRTGERYSVRLSEGRGRSPRFYTTSKSETVMDRGMPGIRHLSRFAECTMLNTGTLLRDVNGSGEYLRGQLRRESPEALRWRQYRKREAPWLDRGTKRQVGNKTT